MTQPTHNPGFGEVPQEREGPGTGSGGARDAGSPYSDTSEVRLSTAADAVPYDTTPTPTPGASGPSSTSGSSSDGGLTDTAKDTAKEAADRGRDVAGTAADEAKAIGAEAKSQLTALLEQLRGELGTQASDQGQRAARGLGSLGDELRQMADAAPQDGVAGDLVRRIEQQVRSASQWLENREPGELLEDVRSVARRRPGAFLAGAALLGLLGGRLTRGLTDSPTSTSGGGEATGSPTTGTYGVTGATYGTTGGTAGTTNGAESAYGSTRGPATVVPTGSTPATVPDAGVGGLDTGEGLR
ncbi:hypothetical protein [Intrasporangium sp. YIM S08009]|uniref:hypothetical protein n=1 Tax=Intrasporangium zincisolvens TaxID=3080018 RepID=UPI002B05475B|nr:hypothetical protein [Intrasporangium sp. YIM S08009]